MCELLHTSPMSKKCKVAKNPVGIGNCLGRGHVGGEKSLAPLAGGAEMLGPRPSARPRVPRSFAAPRACAVAAFVRPRFGTTGGPVAPIAIVDPPLVTRLDA